MTFPELSAWSSLGRLVVSEGSVLPKLWLIPSISFLWLWDELWREKDRGVCLCVSVCLCVFPFWFVSSYPFFWKKSGVIDSGWPFGVWSVGVMSFAAVRRGVRKASACSSLEGRSSEPCFFFCFCFLFKDREQEGRLGGKGSFTLCCWLFVLSWRDTPYHREWPQLFVSLKLGASGENQKGQTMANCSGILLQVLSRFIPCFGRATSSKPSCSLLNRLTSL